MCNKLVFLFGSLIILILLSFATMEAFNAGKSSSTPSRPSIPRYNPNRYYTDPRSVSNFAKPSGGGGGAGGDVSGGTTGGGRSGGRDSDSPSGSGGSGGGSVSDSRGRSYKQQSVQDDDFNEAQQKCLQQYQDCVAGNRFEGRPDDYNDLADDMW